MFFRRAGAVLTCRTGLLFSMPTKPPVFRSPYEAPRAERPRGTAAQRGYSSDWRRFRLWALSLPENVLCRFRDDPRHKDECTHASTVLDHIQPLADGGVRLDINNVRGLCRRAHEVVTENYKRTGRNELPAKGET